MAQQIQEELSKRYTTNYHSYVLGFTGDVYNHIQSIVKELQQTPQTAGITASDKNQQIIEYTTAIMQGVLNSQLNTKEEVQDQLIAYINNARLKLIYQNQTSINPGQYRVDATASMPIKSTLPYYIKGSLKNRAATPNPLTQ